jgi:hypothetical protein
VLDPTGHDVAGLVERLDEVSDLILDIQDLQFMISNADGSIKLVDPARVVRVRDLGDRKQKQWAKAAPGSAREFEKSMRKRINGMLIKLDQVPL